VIRYDGGPRPGLKLDFADRGGHLEITWDGTNKRRILCWVEKPETIRSIKTARGWGAGFPLYTRKIRTSRVIGKIDTQMRQIKSLLARKMLVGWSRRKTWASTPPEDRGNKAKKGGFLKLNDVRVAKRMQGSEERLA